MTLKVAIGSDHAGFELKNRLKEFLREHEVEVEDVGTFESASVDYPDFARKVSLLVMRGKVDFGILVCGTGSGMTVSANKFPGIRAVNVWNEFLGRQAKEHIDANIIVFGGRTLGSELAKSILSEFLKSSFEGGRHSRRLDKVKQIENTFSLWERQIAELERSDPDVFRAIVKETVKQEYTLNLVASENMPSLKVLAVLFNVMNNKYAEGYPDKRYYGGCEFVDEVEKIAIERAKKLFGAEYANVQPHSGTQANQAVYLAVMKPGDTMLSMELSAGGHLSHGAPVNFSGKIYNPVFYGVDRRTHLIDYDKVRELARKHKPRVIVAGASSYPRAIDWKTLSEIAREVGAYLLADIAHPAGLVAVGLYPSPVPFADFVTLTTHKTLRGPRGGVILARAEHSKKISSALFPGSQGGPQMHVIAGKAVAFGEAMTDEFREYQRRVLENARAMADEFVRLGYKVVTGGTDCHFVLVDLTPFGVAGGDAERALYRAGIVLNRNVIPYDPRPPFNPSGLRIGTPSITARGMGQEEARYIVRLIDRVIRKMDDEEIGRVRREVRELCRSFPYYADLVRFFTWISDFAEEFERSF